MKSCWRNKGNRDFSRKASHEVAGLQMAPLRRGWGESFIKASRIGWKNSGRSGNLASFGYLDW